MTVAILSVPLTPDLAQKIDKLVSDGIATNKAEAARKAIEYFVEEQAVQAVLKAEKEVNEGKILRGNLKKLAKQL